MAPAHAIRLHRSRQAESNSRSSNETSLTPNSTGTPWSHVWNNFDDHSLDATEQQQEAAASSWQEEAHWMSFRHAVQQFASLKIAEVEEQEEESASSQSKSPSPSNSVTSSLASDLAETKMRLALAQAERDELEFALLQRENDAVH